MPKPESQGETQSLIVADNPSAERVDRYLAERVQLMSRSQLKQRVIALRVNGQISKFSHLVVNGDQISLELAPLPAQELVAEDLALNILFENDQVIVINKPSGMVVHPAAGNQSGTLVHGLLFHLQSFQDQEFEDETRPGIVHRLDKDTSGVLIVAKNPAAHEFLSAQFQARTTVKTYLAIAAGKTRFAVRRVEGFLHRDPANRQRYMHDAITGKNAVTDFEMLASNQSYCLLRVQPKTGRTHQIRVHARHIGLPLLGDPIYGQPDPALRLMLHAYRLALVLPGETAAREFTAELPLDFLAAAERLGFSAALPKC